MRITRRKYYTYYRALKGLQYIPLWPCLVWVRVHTQSFKLYSFTGKGKTRFILTIISYHNKI